MTSIMGFDIPVLSLKYLLMIPSIKQDITDIAVMTIVLSPANKKERRLMYDQSKQQRKEKL